MPFTTEEINRASAASLDLYLRNSPIDQIATAKPFLKWLLKHKKSFGGAKENIVEKLRKSYDSNFQWYFGDDVVTYNKKNTLTQAKFPWAGFHDGFELNEDELFQNGIIIDDDVKPKTSSDAERIQLANLLEENLEALTLGIEEALDKDLHRDGSHSDKAIVGLDALVSCDPTVGTIGGIDRATSPWWRNHVSPKVTKTNILDVMEKVWRACIRHGGNPDFILASSDFIDLYTAAVTDKKQVIVKNGNQTDIEGGVDSITFKGIPLIYDPTFEELDDADCPAMPWSKRCYFLNSKHIKLRPAESHWMKKRKPQREHNDYIHRFAITGKLAMTTNRSSAHALLQMK